MRQSDISDRQDDGGPCRPEVKARPDAVEFFAQALLSFSRKLDDPSIDPTEAIDSAMMAVALVLEASPVVGTKRDLRLQSEAWGKRLGELSRYCRARRDQTGVHPLDEIVDRFGECGGNA